MDHDEKAKRRLRWQYPEEEPLPADFRWPGKRTLTASLPGHRSVEAVAARGVQGAAQALPHLERLQGSFDAHDLSGIEAHTGPEAEAACRALGATAYATGNQVAFASAAPDLHTVAHEATHVVQGAGGVHFQSGSGDGGDALEREADAVADQVVAGEQAKLDYAPRGDDDYHGAGGWLHKEIYEPLQRDYSAWMAWGSGWRSEPDALRANARLIGGFVPYVLGAAGKIIVGVPQLLTPRTAEEHFLFGLTAGTAPAAKHVGELSEVRYGYYWLRAELLKRPRLMARLNGAAALMRRASNEAERRAGTLVRRVEGWLQREEGAVSGAAGHGRTPSAGTLAEEAVPAHPPAPAVPDGAAPKPGAATTPAPAAPVTPTAPTAPSAPAAPTAPAAPGQRVIPDPSPQSRTHAAPNPKRRRSLTRMMKKSASDEARQVGWVWAHKIARALGGLDRPENLIAATSEANQIMLVFERMAIAMTKEGRRVDVRAEASLIEGSRVGHQLRLWISAELEREVEKKLPSGEVVKTKERVMEVLLDGATLDLATRDPVPTGANNIFNKDVPIR